MRPARTLEVVSDERAELERLRTIVQDARNISLALQESVPDDEHFAKMALATVSVVLEWGGRR